MVLSLELERRTLPRRMPFREGEAPAEPRGPRPHRCGSAGASPSRAYCERPLAAVAAGTAATCVAAERHGGGEAAAERRGRDVVAGGRGGVLRGEVGIPALDAGHQL